MKWILITFLALFTVFSATGASYANACNSRAQAALSSFPGATLLSVTSEKKANGATVCKVRIWVKPNAGKPGRVVMRSFKL